MVRILSGTAIWSFIWRGFQGFRECSKFSYFLRLFGSGLSGSGKRIPSPGGEERARGLFSYYFDIRHKAIDERI